MPVIKCEKARFTEDFYLVHCTGKEYNPELKETIEVKVTRLIPSKPIKCYNRFVTLHEKVNGAPKDEHKTLYALTCVNTSMLPEEIATLTKSDPKRLKRTTLKKLKSAGLVEETERRFLLAKQYHASDEMYDKLKIKRIFFPNEEYLKVNEDTFKELINYIDEKIKKS